jgi:hypothetical protein
MVTVLPISKFAIVSSYVIKYALLIVGIESNPGPQLNNKKNIKIIHNKIVVYTYKQDTHNIRNASEKPFIIRQDIFT